MGKLIKYLADHKLAVLVILLLLGVQAFCDLSLPSYTSDIVDVGIQQGGIEGAAAEKYTQETYEALKKYGQDLVEAAKAHKLDPVIGRDAEIRNVIRILSRKTKNNPVLIGEILDGELKKLYWRSWNL